MAVMEGNKQDQSRLTHMLASIDAVNAEDPVHVSINGKPVAKALLYGQRMSQVLHRFAPEASVLLQIAARAQHIERWTIPRNSYPEGRVAYLKWRKDLQHHHAARTASLMREQEYGEDEIARVASLLRKERLKADPETQTLEDVICLVFLEYEAAEFIREHEDEKVISILAKTAKKMSEHGLAAASKLELDPRLSRLLSHALDSDASVSTA